MIVFVLKKQTYQVQHCVDDILTWHLVYFDQSNKQTEFKLVIAFRFQNVLNRFNLLARVICNHRHGFASGRVALNCTQQFLHLYNIRGRVHQSPDRFWCVRRRV